MLTPQKPSLNSLVAKHKQALSKKEDRLTKAETKTIAILLDSKTTIGKKRKLLNDLIVIQSKLATVKQQLTQTYETTL